MPFAMNEATRFISPTKTPGYLAAGRQVVSIPVRDVVRHYGDLFAVHIADGAAAFARACETALAATAAPAAWRDQADAALATQSCGGCSSGGTRIQNGQTASQPGA